MTKKLAAFLALTLLGTVCAAQNAAVPNSAARGSVPTMTSAMLRKAYPGGRDESDLSVQPRKRITRKGGQADEAMEGEGPEVESSGGEEFGE